MPGFRVVHLNHRAPAVFRLKDRHFIISQGIKELLYEMPLMLLFLLLLDALYILV